MPDLTTPVPDDGHEALRQAAVDAVTQLDDHLDRLGDAMLLVLTAFDFAQTMLQAVVPLQAAAADLQGQVTALADRVTALEQSPAPVEAP